MDGARRAHNNAGFFLLLIPHLVAFEQQLCSACKFKELFFTVLGEQKIIRPNFIYYNDIIIIYYTGNFVGENNTRLKDERILVSTRPCRFEVGPDDRTTT